MIETIDSRACYAPEGGDLSFKMRCTDMQTKVSFNENVDLPLLWGWIQEFPNAHLYNGSPKTLTEFTMEMATKKETQRFFIAYYDGVPVGAIGFEERTENHATIGMFRGICFSKSTHRTGIPRICIFKFLKDRFSLGVSKYIAGFFRSNDNIRNFLLKLGGNDMGIEMRAEERFTTLTGQPLVYSWIVIEKEELCLSVDC